VFKEYPWREDPPDVRRERLCARPGGNPVQLACTLEGASFVPGEAPPPDEIVIMAYNLERGLRAKEQVEALKGGGGIPPPDIVLVSESDRGCTRTKYGNVTADWARALGMNYVYGVEFVELPRVWGPAGGRMCGRCEHGNAVLSRFPLGNARLVRYEKNFSWHSWWQRLLYVGEPRLGGRMALAVDVKLGDRYLHLYSVHFESRGSDVYRPAQARETAEDAVGQPFGSIIGGDFNCTRYLDDLREGTTRDIVTQALLQRGFADAHAKLAPEERVTSRSGLVIDGIFGRDAAFLEAGVGKKETWGDLSDHLPVWARLRLS
jgi:endonuclease/exonuclease/phosphatase family metal-dependent hydrolase